MKLFLRLVLVGLFLCFFAGTISAQSITFVMPGPPSSPFSGDPDPVVVPDDWSLGTDYSGTLYGDSSTSDSTADSSSDSSAYGYAHGDNNFVSSTYMDYDTALELGKEILAQQQAATPTPPETNTSLSLPQVARNLNLKPTISPGANCVVLDQDDSGNVVVCADGTSSCHPLD